VNKKIIGYTTGVFDLFHIGHLNILKRAKEQCDYLIVGISTDELVEHYNNRKPIIPFEERIEIVAAIKYVDRAVVQRNIDKLAAWRELNFNILFHGDDWKNTPMYNEIEKQFHSIGVNLIFFPYTQGTSSTMINHFLQENK